MCSKTCLLCWEFLAVSAIDRPESFSAKALFRAFFLSFSEDHPFKTRQNGTILKYRSAVLMISRPILLALTLSLAGCDLIDQLLADPKAAQKIADSKAIGSACRHGMRSIEDCYTLNEKASKAAVFDGWKEMDQYMRDNKIDGVEPKGMKPVQPVEEVIVEAKPKGKPKADAAH
jgi:hypothetical protein